MNKIKCPNCDSTTQSKVITTEYNENGLTIEVVRYYICTCGATFIGKSYYHCQEDYEIVEPYSRKKLQEKLFGRG